MSYRYAILGAGRQGIAAAYDLARHGDAKEIVLYDIDQPAAQKATAPVITTALRLVLRKHVQNIQDIFRYYRERTDPFQFEDKCRYFRLLFELA